MKISFTPDDAGDLMILCLTEASRMDTLASTVADRRLATPLGTAAARWRKIAGRIDQARDREMRA